MVWLTVSGRLVAWYTLLGRLMVWLTVLGRLTGSGSWPGTVSNLT